METIRTDDGDGYHRYRHISHVEGFTDIKKELFLLSKAMIIHSQNMCMCNPNQRKE